MPTSYCIYCSPDRPTQTPYTREHVVPEAFGKFRDNLVLNEGVCHDCNKFFGDKLEVIFGRGSLESVLRLDYRIKPLTNLNKLRKDRVVFALSTTGDLDGLILECQEENGELIVALVRQVGFPHINGNGRIYVSASDLANLSVPLPQEADTTKDVFLIFDTEEVRQKLIQDLLKRNVKANEVLLEASLPMNIGVEINVATKSKIDDIVLRCIAKIAFNYLAKTAGLSFVLRNDFNAMRSYIRYGTEPGYDFVKISDQPILASDSKTQRETKGHLIIVDFPAKGKDVIAQVSLFNLLTYEFLLAKDFSGLWQNIISGHHFSITEMKVDRLQAITSILPLKIIRKPG